MPRISFSNDFLVGSSWRTFEPLTNCFDDNRQPSSLVRELIDTKQPSTLSPNEIDEILSRKLYNHLQTTSSVEKEEQNSNKKSDSYANPLPTSLLDLSTINIVDPELTALIDRFFYLTYLNTIPMVNLLSTAVATNFLKENIRELDKKLQEQHGTHTSIDAKRGTSLLYQSGNDDDDDDDDNLSWASAPT